MIVYRIALVEFDDASAAQLMRLHLEQLGFDVALNRPGKPSDVFDAFRFHGQPADAVVIAAHGDDGGFIFPEMAGGVDQLVLPDNRITCWSRIIPGFHLPLPRPMRWSNQTVSSACLRDQCAWS